MINWTCSISHKEIGRIVNIQNISPFWDTTKYNPVNTNRHFGGTYRLHREGLRRIQEEKPAEAGSKVNMEMIFHPKGLQITWRCKPEGWIFHTYSNKNFQYKVYNMSSYIMGSHFASMLESVDSNPPPPPPPKTVEHTSELKCSGDTRRSLKAWNLPWFCYCFITSRQWLSLFRYLVLAVVLRVGASGSW
jgi:hypothetical protein